MKFATGRGNFEGRSDASSSGARFMSASSRARADATRASWSSRQTRFETEEISGMPQR